MPLPLVAGIVTAITAALSGLFTAFLGVLGVGSFFTITVYLIKLAVKLSVIVGVSYLIYSALLAFIPDHTGTVNDFADSHRILFHWAAWVFHFREGVSIVATALVWRWLYSLVMNTITNTN